MIKTDLSIWKSWRKKEEWFFISGVIEPEKMNREGERGRDRESVRNGKYIMKAWICIKKKLHTKEKKMNGSGDATNLFMYKRQTR